MPRPKSPTAMRAVRQQQPRAFLAILKTNDLTSLSNKQRRQQWTALEGDWVQVPLLQQGLLREMKETSQNIQSSAKQIYCSLRITRSTASFRQQARASEGHFIWPRRSPGKSPAGFDVIFVYAFELIVFNKLQILSSSMTV